MLSEAIEAKGHKVIHAQRDADVLIALTALKVAETRDVVAIGEDTDILVLLLYHITSDHKQVVFKSAMKQRSSKSTKVWDVNKTQTVLGKKLCRALPVIHAITGCDTTSQLYGIGKGASLKKFCANDNLVQLADVFLAKSMKEAIETAGENILVLLYGGLPVEGLNILRFRKFSTKVMSSSTHVQVQTLPPTSAAAKYHSLRVYFQVQEWIVDETSFLPTDWGWTIRQNKLVPLKTDLPAAPDNLLNMIRCRCKQNCDSKRCTCRKNGLECSTGCSECRGVSCTNAAIAPEIDSDEEQIVPNFDQRSK